MLLQMSMHPIALLITLTLGVNGAFAGDRPNVLFVIADDLNCDLGCYGHNEVQSPTIDRLAAKGVRFARAYVQYTVCNPSRTSFLTGLRPTTTGIMDNGTHFRKKNPNAVTLPQLFRQNGYFVAGLGKVFHRGFSPDEKRPEMDDSLSFDHVFYGANKPPATKGEGRNLTGGSLNWCRWLANEGEDSDNLDGQLADEAVRLLEEKRDKPFFLAVGFYRPHDPFISPKKYFDRYRLEALTLPTTPAGYVPPFPQCLAAGTFGKAFDKFGEQEKREFLRSYYAGVSFVDQQLAKILAALERFKLDKKTIVVFVGDHGYELGVRNWWNKNTLFERSCRTPLIVYDPSAAGNGMATQSITEFIDLYPTLVESCRLAGSPSNLEGTSFRPVLTNPMTNVKDAAVTVISRGKFQGRSIRTDRWRMSEWDEGKKGVELYDHSNDAGEFKNLASDPQFRDIQAQLRLKWK